MKRRHGGRAGEARKLFALGLDARIIAAQLVSPYRRQGASGKNDANDAAAICEAASGSWGQVSILFALGTKRSTSLT